MKREAVPGSAEAAENPADDDGGVDDGIEDYRGSATKVSCFKATSYGARAFWVGTSSVHFHSHGHCFAAGPGMLPEGL